MSRFSGVLYKKQTLNGRFVQDLHFRPDLQDTGIERLDGHFYWLNNSSLPVKEFYGNNVYLTHHHTGFQGDTSRLSYVDINNMGGDARSLDL